MKSSFQDLIQYIIIKTSFFPFTFFYRKLYELSVTVASLSLRRVDGVLAIYLRRGMAKGEVVYGLSDIDLTVIVRDVDAERESAKEKVKATYNLLSRFIPLFGSGAKELGVYTASEFLNLYNDYGFYKYRFNEGKHTWRLLFGKDTVKTLSQLEDSQLYLPATEELKTWWLLLNAELTRDSVHPGFKSKYLWYKAISEASKVYLFVCQGVTVRSREAALNRVKNFLTHEQCGYIERVQGYLSHLTSKKDLISDELLELFIKLVSETFAGMERKVFSDLRGKEAIIRAPGRSELVAGIDLDSMLKALEATARKELDSSLDSISLIPQVEFNADALSNSDIDSFYLVLVQKGSMPVERMRSFLSFFAADSNLQNIEPFFVTDGNIAFSLRVDRIHNSIKIKSPRACPLFYSLLNKSISESLHPPLGENDAPIRCRLPPDTFEETIRRRVAKINQIVSNRDIYKMKPLDFLRFFLGAARTKLLARSLDAEEIHIPITSGQILEMLLQSFPEDSAWLRDLQGAYAKELLGEESESYRFFAKSVELLNRI